MHLIMLGDFLCLCYTHYITNMFFHLELQLKNNYLHSVCTTITSRSAFLFKAPIEAWGLFFPSLFLCFAFLYFSCIAQKQNQERLIPTKKLSATNLLLAGKPLQEFIHCMSLLGRNNENFWHLLNVRNRSTSFLKQKALTLKTLQEPWSWWTAWKPLQSFYFICLSQEPADIAY